MDAEGDWLPERLVYQVNAVLPPDIAVMEILPASPAFHARFDAVSRCYRYYIHFRKDPFREGRSMYFQQPALLDRSRMEDVASVLLDYEQFRPFCKTGAEEKHFRCAMQESAWAFDAGGAVYTIRANRFLRGMVRLIVGTGLNAGLGKLTREDVKLALDNQLPIPQAWSVPAEGLYLEDIRYPE
jgi:tRNA pseudouridine38-40 synthase